MCYTSDRHADVTMLQQEYIKNLKGLSTVMLIGFYTDHIYKNNNRNDSILNN